MSFWAWSIAWISRYLACYCLRAPAKGRPASVSKFAIIQWKKFIGPSSKAGVNEGQSHSLTGVRSKIGCVRIRSPEKSRSHRRMPPKRNKRCCTIHDEQFMKVGCYLKSDRKPDEH